MIELDNPVKAVPDGAAKGRDGEQSSRRRIQQTKAIQQYTTASKLLDNACDKVMRLTSRLLNAPLAMVILTHANKVWYQSHYGAQEVFNLSEQINIDIFDGVLPCASFILDSDLELRNFEHPVKVGACGFHFYAAVPLISSQGRNIGNFCILDRDIRTLDDSEIATLKDLAAIAADEIELRIAAPIEQDGNALDSTLQPENEQPIQIVGEQGKLEKILCESEERYHSLIGMLSDWHWEQDVNFRFVLITATNETNAQKKYRHHIGKTFQELPDLEMSKEDWSILDKRLMKHQPFQEFTLKHKREDGQLQYLSISGQPIFSPEGIFKGYRGIAKDITDKVRAQEELAQSNAALRELSVGFQAFREAERKRIARELHDELAQLLATSRMELCLLQQDLTPATSSRQRFASLDQMIGSSILSLRKLATDLRPSSLDEGGLYYALRTLLKSFSETTGIDCQLIANEAELDLDETCSTAVFRLVQESLANIGRHADAKEVSIQIYRKDKKLEIRVQDDGKGIRAEDMKKEKAFGLLDMRGRVAEMNGKMEITGRLGKGTRIAVSLPLFK